jgi:PEP-CTERM motif
MLNTTKLGRLFTIILLVDGCTAPAWASHPDILHSFRLIPNKSRIFYSGGFAGFNFGYELSGKFDIVTGFEEGFSCTAIGCPPPPTHIPYAKFENVRVTAFDLDPRVDAFPVPLNRFVDLEAMRGTFSPLEPRRLIFLGEDQHSQPFYLLAVQRGRLLHLVGASREECCNLVQYKLDALAHIAPYADFNFDGSVDSADYTTWRKNVGMTIDATLETGDADGDGDVDGDDYAVFREQFGTSVNLAELAADSPANLSLTSAAVPEPATPALMLMAAAIAASLRRARA